MTRKYRKYNDTHRTIEGVKQKLCITCEEWKPEIGFHRDRLRKDDLKSKCRECSCNTTGKSTRRRNLPYEECHRVVNGVKQKLCAKCSRWKAENEFSKNRSGKDGLAPYCRECTGTYYRGRYRKNKKSVRERLRYEDRHRTVKGLKEKLCSLCKQWKAESHFSKERRSKDGLQSFCKKCARVYRRKRYEQINDSPI